MFSSIYAVLKQGISNDYNKILALERSTKKVKLKSALMTQSADFVTFQFHQYSLVYNLDSLTPVLLKNSSYKLQKNTILEISVPIAESETMQQYLDGLATFECFLQQLQYVSQEEERLFGLCKGCWPASCCKRACEYMLGNTKCANCADKTISEKGYSMQTTSILVAKYDNDLNWVTDYDNKSIINVNNTAAKAYLIDQVKIKKVPVIVGVHYTNRGVRADGKPLSPPGNNNKATYHFIVVVGYGKDKDGEYFRFYDPGRSIAMTSEATSSKNKLYVENGFIRGNYRNRIYTITEIIKTSLNK